MVQSFALLQAVALWGACDLAQAGGITVSPVIIEMNSPRKPVAVTITNDNDHPLRLQSAGLVWRQQGGRDRYDPTDDVLVVPAIVEVPAHSSQVFRVALRQPSTSPIERTYRVMLEDISDAPPAAEPGGPSGNAIALRFNHNLALMVSPASKIVQTVHWATCSSETAVTTDKPSQAQLTGQACVRVRNTGNRRLKVQKLTISGDGWQQTLALKDGFNLLAGADREWILPLNAGQLNPVRSLQVETAQGQSLKGEADAP